MPLAERQRLRRLLGHHRGQIRFGIRTGASDPGGGQREYDGIGVRRGGRQDGQPSIGRSGGFDERDDGVQPLRSERRIQQEEVGTGERRRDGDGAGRRCLECERGPLTRIGPPRGEVARDPLSGQRQGDFPGVFSGGSGE